MIKNPTAHAEKRARQSNGFNSGFTLTFKMKFKQAGILLMLLMAMAADADTNVSTLVPLPQKMEFGQGTFEAEAGVADIRWMQLLKNG